MGAIFGGLNGVPLFIYIGLVLMALTVVLGDKLLLFILGARKVQIKELSFDTLISSFGCANRLRALRIYSFHSNEISLCLINSIITHDRSLVISDSALKHEKAINILEEGLANVTLEKNVLCDLAVIICYQVLFIGYFLGTFSTTLKDVYFYLLRPITLMKDYLIRRDLTNPLSASLLISNQKRDRERRPHIINDIVKDYGIIESSNSSLWSLLGSR